MLRPFRSQGFCEVGHGCFRGVVGALLLGVKDTGAGDRGDENYGARAVGVNHVLGAGLRDEEGAGHVYVEKRAEFGGGIVFGFEVGA